MTEQEIDRLARRHAAEREWVEDLTAGLRKAPRPEARRRLRRLARAIARLSETARAAQAVEAHE